MTDPSGAMPGGPAKLLVVDGDGYTRLVEMLLHDIQVETDVDFGADYSYWRRQAEKVIYTGALDELMGNQFGELEDRSLIFETQRVEADDVQGCPTVNYPGKDVPWTVINEWKHYGWQTEPEGHTIITTQTPAAFEDTGERYYPDVDEENRERHAKYVEALEEGIIPAGRLGRFQYLNMDQAVGAALVLADKPLPWNLHEAIDAINYFLFTEYELRGDRQSYDDPQNAVLPKVIARRRGLPIPLSTLWIDVARRLGFDAMGIALPGHFITALHTDMGNLYFDPFNGGRALGEEEAASLVRRASQGRLTFTQEMLRPVEHRTILARLVRNLHVRYVHQGLWDEALWTSTHLVILIPNDPSPHRDRASFGHRSTDCPR